jgi:type IV pilus assembly protein PilQ
MSVRNLGRLVTAAVGLALVLWAAAGRGDGMRLVGVEVLDAGGAARVVLDVNGTVKHRVFTLANPDRVVVDLVDVVNGVAQASRTYPASPVARLRVSQFRPLPAPVTRVVADLRTKVPFGVQTQDEDVVLVVGTTETATSPAESTSAEVSATPAPVVSESTVAFLPVPSESVTVAPEATVAVVETPADTQVVPVVETVAEAPAGGQVDSQAVVETPSMVAVDTVAVAAAAVGDAAEATVEVAAVFPEPALDATAAAGAAAGLEDTSPEAPPGGVELKPTGSDKRINLDVQGADIHTVLRTLADYSGKNIIASREVEGEVTARLYDIPWEDALRSVLRAHGYGYVEENGIVRVGVLQKIRNEELEEAAADRKREDLLPIETQVVRLQFADAEELKPSLADMLSQRGKLQVDARTNALIVSDIPGYVAKVAAMAADLDSRTPQVEIVSKLVDVSLDDSKNLGIVWSAKNIRPSGSAVGGSATVEAPTTGALGNLLIGTVQSWGQLEAMLDALARSKKANVVSNPNITTVNNREAKILVGQKIPLIVADQAGNAITQLTKIGIQMHVTPHVNSDRTITMDLHTEVSELSSQATVQGGVIIQTSEADTRVLVENGDTAVIGGLMRNVQTELRTGIPVLQDIPLLGWLFRNTNKVNDKRDLIIFVTPKLREAGSNGQN